MNINTPDKDDERFYIKYLRKDGTHFVGMKYFRTRSAAIYALEKLEDFQELVKLYPKANTDCKIKDSEY